MSLKSYERRTVAQAKRETARVQAAEPPRRQKERKRKAVGKKLHAKAMRNANKRALEDACNET